MNTFESSNVVVPTAVQQNNFQHGNTSSFHFRCAKCSCTEFDTDKFQATGGGFSKAFDVQNKKFVIIYCKNCGYAEMYKAESSILGNIADFLF